MQGFLMRLEVLLKIMNAYKTLGSSFSETQTSHLNKNSSCNINYSQQPRVLLVISLLKVIITQ